MNILAAIRDRHVFGNSPAASPTWAAWRAFLAALFALDMTDAEAEMYRTCTGRAALPTTPHREAWLVCGRRAGKSFVLALVAVFLAVFHDYRRHLAPGERATIMVIATDRKQARTIFRYVRGLLGSPLLEQAIESETAESIDLTNHVTIEVGTASHRSIRGYTIAAALCDEIAFWPTDDAAEPDFAILDALRPGMATIPGAMLLCASSPYARRGALWDAFHNHYGRDGDPVFVWQAGTVVMNPTVPQSIIDQAMERDPAVAGAEWLAQFRTDVERLFTREAVVACVATGVIERAPVPKLRYHAFVDPSGGSNDAMTLAIGHRQDDIAVLDAIRERKPPFSPEAVVEEFAALLKSYRVSTVVGDRYGGEWPRERFRKHGIDYRVSDKPRSDLYRDMLPAVNSGRVDLLDIDRLTNQLIRLERRTSRGGKDMIDHAPGAQDDLANAVAGAIAALLTKQHEPSMRGPGLPIVGGGSRAINLNDEFPQSLATHNWLQQRATNGE
jgi:hypothetical protein